MLRVSDAELKQLIANRQRKQRPDATLCQGARESDVTLDDYQDEDRKTPKYRNRRVEFEGIWFDSKHEAETYANLMLMKRGGAIRAIARQVKFDLPGGIKYVADFVVIFPDYHCEVWDAKSPITKQNRVYINKKKQMKACWGIDIIEV